MKKIYLLLALVLAAGGMLRLYHALAFEMPLGSDSYYHARVAKLVLDIGAIPSEEPWPEGGRPHIYPPLYHLLLSLASMLSGISVLGIARFALPIFSLLTVLPVYYLVSKFRDGSTALLAAFFTALSPALIFTSYDSPQVISIFLAAFAAYAFLKERYYLAGLFLGFAYLLNSFSALAISAPLAIMLVSERKYKKLFDLFMAPAIFALAWYLPRLGSFSCLDNGIGPHFIGAGLSSWLAQETLVIVAALAIAYALFDRVTDRFRKFWGIWVLFFTIVFLTHFITPSLYPWRQDVFIAFGFGVLLADVLLNSSRRKVFFTVFFVLLFAVGSKMVFDSQYMRPALQDGEYSLVSWVDKNVPGNASTLAYHDMCAGVLALTNKSCLLDISFECIQNRSAWFDYAEFFWYRNQTQMEGFFAKYRPDYVLYGMANPNRPLLEGLGPDKVYVSWQCAERCTRDAAAYRVAK